MLHCQTSVKDSVIFLPGEEGGGAKIVGSDIWATAKLVASMQFVAVASFLGRGTKQGDPIFPYPLLVGRGPADCSDACVAGWLSYSL